MMCGVELQQVWRVKQCPGSGFTQGVGLAVGAQHHPPILALLLHCTLLCYFQLPECCPLCRLPLVTAKSKSKDLSPGKRATAGRSKGSFTTSGKTARNPNFFLALGFFCTKNETQ